MGLIVILCLSAPFLMTALLHLFGVRSRGILLGIPAVLVALPVLLLFALYLFRTPVQQGKFLAGLGPVLNLVFPAEDLYDPLATVKLQSDKAEYKLDITHRYVGMHAVKVNVPGEFGIRYLENDLKISLKIYDGRTLLHQVKPASGGQFWGKDDHGLYFAPYSVPRDAPIGTQLTAMIHVTGDLNLFLKGREGVTVSVSKMSDE